jgi:biopolymer transport protein ExbD
MDMNRQIPFIINADGKTPYQFVISAMDIANQIGVQHISFAINLLDKK